MIFRLKYSNATLYVLDHLHVARQLVMELIDLPAKVVARVPDTVAEWEPAPPRGDGDLTPPLGGARSGPPRSYP